MPSRCGRGAPEGCCGSAGRGVRAALGRRKESSAGRGTHCLMSGENGSRYVPVRVTGTMPMRTLARLDASRQRLQEKKQSQPTRRRSVRRRARTSAPVKRELDDDGREGREWLLDAAVGQERRKRRAEADLARRREALGRQVGRGGHLVDRHDGLKVQERGDEVIEDCEGAASASTRRERTSREGRTEDTPAAPQPRLVLTLRSDELDRIRRRPAAELVDARPRLAQQLHPARCRCEPTSSVLCVLRGEESVSLARLQPRPLPAGERSDAPGRVSCCRRRGPR